MSSPEHRCHIATVDTLPLTKHTHVRQPLDRSFSVPSKLSLTVLRICAHGCVKTLTYAEYISDARDIKAGFSGERISPEVSRHTLILAYNRDHRDQIYWTSYTHTNTNTYSFLSFHPAVSHVTDPTTSNTTTTNSTTKTTPTRAHSLHE